MKKVFFLSLLVFFCSCKHSRIIEEDEILNVEYPDAPEPANLQFPNTDLNLLSSGAFSFENIQSLEIWDYNHSTPFMVNFETIPGTKKISSFTTQNYNTCLTPRVDYQYLSNGKIDKITSTAENRCQEYSIKTVGQFLYQSNVVKGILRKDYYIDATGEKLVAVAENYFSYFPDGKIKTMYADFRGIREKFDRYYTFEYTYDENGNVKECIQNNPYSPQYSKKYSYTYSSQKNPLKNIFTFSSDVSIFHRNVVMSYGASFLSENCIKSVKSESINSSNSQPRFYYFSAEENGGNTTLIQAEDTPYWNKVFIHH